MTQQKHLACASLCVLAMAAAASVSTQAQSRPQPQSQVRSAVQAQTSEAQELTRRLNAAPARAQVTVPDTGEQTAAVAPRPSPRPAARPVPAQPEPTHPASAASDAAAWVEPEGTEILVETAEPPKPLRSAESAPLTRSAIAALPFTLDLGGAQIVERAVGPGQKIYTVRQDDNPLLMIHTGPVSQFPIYQGETVEVGGRSSIVVAQDGRRIAVEHLFRREGREPTDVHIWLLVTDGEAGLVAERIGQSIDVQ